ncbi:MAG: aminotransferase class V-fold PLP-dependent enzyme [Gemmatimonadetes bacterium]|nr:aminotransferase class V-fold PLP-dependent enzyme [Gemmatimonadota bacterium]MCC7132916.1 aminotransferase class V-fold PLP-dependent enzyme [Gemmatimonadales bacterium]
MSLDRRGLLRGLGSLAATGLFTRAGELPALDAPSRPFQPGFPRKADFRIPEGRTYLSGAFTHPMPIAAAEAYHRAIDNRATVGGSGGWNVRPKVDPRAAFAALINAKPSEISYLPNTSTGENLVVECLGIRKFDGNVVTDALHFEGALIHLMELQKEGLDLRVAPARDGRIDLRDLERLVDRKTRLVEVSLVSMYNGFQHDLKAVCDLAHAHGAYVYADIIQGVGAVPFDVRATNVDFAATATYKWLMGDFGLGFFYVREDLLGRVVRRPHWSYESATDADIHLSPTDPRSPTPVTWTPGPAASHYFQLGTMASAVSVALGVSLPYLQELGVAEIQRHRQPLLERIQRELPRLGFIPQTPPESTSPIVTFAHRDPEGISRKLERAGVTIRVAPHWIRIAPSVYNDLADVDRLLEALS